MRRTTVLAICLLLAGSGVASADQVVTFLDDYEVTSDLADVAHLGDQTISYFVRPATQGVQAFWTFDLPVPVAPGGTFTVDISHFQSNPELDYFNYVSVNGTRLGYLDTSDEHWHAQTLIGDTDLLQLTGNTLLITVGRVGGNYDDVEFTDLYMTYVPEPATAGLVGLGLGCLAARRRRSASR